MAAIDAEVLFLEDFRLTFTELVEELVVKLLLLQLPEEVVLMLDPFSGVGGGELNTQIWSSCDTEAMLVQFPVLPSGDRPLFFLLKLSPVISSDVESTPLSIDRFVTSLRQPFRLFLLGLLPSRALAVVLADSKLTDDVFTELRLDLFLFGVVLEPPDILAATGVQYMNKFTERQMQTI